jgi:hypothetical protein
MTEIEHTSALVRAFLAPERQDRYLALLRSARGREKLRARLAHFRDLDRRFARPISPAEHTSASITRLLRARGAPAMCVVLAEDPALDGREVPLEEALSAVVGRGMGAFVSCLPGRLAYFEGEEPGERYLLERAS